MQQHNLQQGSDAWHKFRAEHFGASEASAMLGLSPYTSRSDLLKTKATGITKGVDAATQRVFDRGHEVEALVRPIIESQLGEDLYPVTASRGKLSASCDGLTMCGSIAWENKQYNAKLFASISAGELPEHHWPQAQQVLYVTGAEKLIFTCSDGTLEKTVSMDVYPDETLHKALVEGWAQFEIDLANYTPVIHADKPLPDAIKELPILFVHAYGEITTNNMQDYGDALAERLKEVRSIVLVEDKDFANANKAAKDFRGQIIKLQGVKGAMLEQTTSIGEAARMIDMWCEDLRVTALQLEKDVKREDAAKKESIVNGAKFNFSKYLREVEKEFTPLYLTYPAPVFANAIAKKRDYNSMQNAVDTMLANEKIAVDSLANDMREKLAYFNETAVDYKFLFNDLQQMIGFEKSHFEMAVRVRIDTHKKAEADKIEAQRLQMQAEEEAKAREKAQAEQEARLEAERAIIREEERVKADTEAKTINAEKVCAAVELADQLNPCEKQVPTRFGLITAVANDFGVSGSIAEQWLVEEFSREETV